MKNFFLFLAFLVLIQKQTIAQPIGWYWSNKIASNNDTYGEGITTDVFGNVYVTGGYVGSTFSLGTTTYTGSGSSGMYIAKYDVSGSVLWVKSTGPGCTGWGVSTDSNGNVFVTGQFAGSSLIFGTYTLTSNTIYNDLFTVKFDPNGSVLWAKSEGGAKSDVGRSISIDASGNAFVTGYFQSPSLTIGTYNLSNVGQSMLAIKYDPNGVVLWAASGSGTNPAFWAQGNSISADANGNALVSGYFRNSPVILGTYSLTSAGSNDLFVVKFDPNGSVLWAKSAGSTLSDESTAVSTDLNGNVFLTGSFQSTLMVLGTYSLTNSSPPNANIFIAKYDTSGNTLWAKGLGSGEGAGICTNSGGSAYVAGYYNSLSMVFGTSTLTTNGAADVFVVKYDALGNELSSASAGGSLDDYGTAIVSDGAGNVFVTGIYKSSSAMFGLATLNNNANTSNSDAFVGRLGLCNGTPISPTDVTPSGNKFFCDATSTTLSVAGTGIINWYSSPTSTLTLGSGYNFISPVLSLGNYTYYAEANTCTNSISRTAVTVTVDACLGFANITSPESIFSVYPNPFQDKLFINYSALVIDKLSISNAIGEIILQWRNYDISQSLDVNNLPKGIYFLKVEHEKEQTVIKLVKE